MAERIERLDMTGLQIPQADQIQQCTACGLCRCRKHPVPGRGNPNADIMIVGEGPGAQEDEQGVPFVGPSGVLLSRLLRDAQIEESQVFITNVVKCRPPGNRDPKPEEARACKKHLLAQVREVAPKVVVCLGKHAAWYVTAQYGPVGALMEIGSPRTMLGKVSGPAVICYHPAYLLRLLNSNKVRAKEVYLDYILRLKIASSY